MQFRLNKKNLLAFDVMQIIYPSEAINAGIATNIIPTDAVAARRDVLTITNKLIKILI